MIKLVVMVVQIWFIDGTYTVDRLYYDNMESCNVSAYLNSGRFDYHVFSVKTPPTIYSYSIDCKGMIRDLIDGKED